MFHSKSLTFCIVIYFNLSDYLFTIYHLLASMQNFVEPKKNKNQRGIR
jgi:hypothetical protein